ncbi:hypothetical protein ABZ621_15705 [Streptomyces sp. NPDC007863]|uniref:hypothetical protein n=1 Tax=Streptomyces sp. NPDC007863 TaxID=3154894 RepID=UPI0033D27A80
MRQQGHMRWAGGVAAVVGASVLGVVLFGGGGEVPRPGAAGSGLGVQLGALRGANDLVRAGRDEVGRTPALYPTAYGRLEAAVGGAVPPVRGDALVEVVRRDAVDTAAWRAYYVCLATDGDRRAAGGVVDRAGIRREAEREAVAYLRAPDRGDDAPTSLMTRAAFLRVLDCLGRGRDVPRAAVARLAADVARGDQPAPALYAVEALRAAGVEATPTRVLRETGSRAPDDCAGLEAVQRAALTLLGGRSDRSTRACLRPALSDPDPQTRWLVRRALSGDAPEAAAALPPPAARVGADGLVARTPAQMGTLSATYDAARALAAGGRPGEAPGWLVEGLRRLGTEDGLDPADRVLLAMTCHRLSLECGPQAEKGAEEAAALAVPGRLTPANRRSWYGAMSARAEFGLGCRPTVVDLPAGDPDLAGVAAVLGEAGCTERAAELVDGTDLVGLARRALRNGDLVAASDAVRAALAAGVTVPQAFWDELPALLARHRDARYPDLYAEAAGGTAAADATLAAYLLLA